MLTPDELEEYLDILQDKKVTHFSCPEFTVSMTAVAGEVHEDMSQAIKEGNEASKSVAVHGVFAHRSLWPDGKPPSFPKASKE